MRCSGCVFPLQKHQAIANFCSALPFCASETIAGWVHCTAGAQKDPRDRSVEEIAGEQHLGRVKQCDVFNILQTGKSVMINESKIGDSPDFVSNQ